MKRTRVKSSSIVSVGYDGRQQILELEFQGGRLYQYFDVPRQVYDELVQAESIGRFVNRSVKGNYRCLALCD
jgi:hypothetical protein